MEVIETLGEIGDPAAIPVLIKTLRSSDGRWLGSRIVDALGQIGDTAAVLGLIEVLSDERWSMRQSAAYQLGEIGEPAKEAVPALIKALSDEEGYVRVRAADALMKIDGSKRTLVTPVLIQLLSDENHEIRDMAVDALKKIGTPEAKKAVEEFERNSK